MIRPLLISDKHTWLIIWAETVKFRQEIRVIRKTNASSITSDMSSKSQKLNDEQRAILYITLGDVFIVMHKPWSWCKTQISMKFYQA